jgi:fumarate hydratase subunit beta
MTREIHLSSPIRIKDIDQLVIADKVFNSGAIYTARDTAHKMMMVLLDKGEPFPFNISGQIINYVGPTPAQPERPPLGFAGPTTSYRMDAYAFRLIEKAMKGMIGKAPVHPKLLKL